MRAVLRVLAAAWWIATAAACQSEPAWSGAVPAPDRVAFETTVYPLLLRDCGFSACHGAERRFFQVFGPGRTRLEVTGPDAERLAQERQLTYERACSMLVGPDPSLIQSAPLLTKPLEVVAGGASHKGLDNFGRNVFQSTADPRYLTLLGWAQGALQPPAAMAAAAAAPSVGITPAAGAAAPSVGVGP
jgi:hypothetical protein